ncbi:MAG: hypothetical protein J6C46_06720 [Clostridia bacterium]|nr:hypothetical protein [Clostridia bacterium]
MSKVLKVILEVLLMLSIVALIIVFLIFTARSEIVPDIYVTSDSGKIAKAIRGGYKWNSFSDSVVADAIAPEDYEYTNENTLLVTPGEIMIFKNSDNPLNCYKFYQLEMKYYDNYNIENIVPNPDDSKAYADLKYLELKAPEQEGTYIYNFTFSYYNNGEVDYGLKVVVSTEPTYEIDDLASYKNTEIVDAKSINSILEVLPYSNYKNSIIVKTNSIERELIVNYSEFVMNRKDLKNNVIALFTLIPDLNIITYKSKQEAYTFTRSEIESQIGRSLEDYVNDFELWKKEILYKEKVIDENVSKDDIYRAIIMDVLSNYNKQEVEEILIDTESFKNTEVLQITNVDRQEILEYVSEYANVVYDISYEEYKNKRSDSLFIGVLSMQDKASFIEEQISGDIVSSINKEKIDKEETQDSELDKSNIQNYLEGINIDLENNINNYFGENYDVLKNQYICTILVCKNNEKEIYNYEVEYKNEKWNITEL